VQQLAGDVGRDGVRNLQDENVEGDAIRNHRDRDVDGDGLRNRRDRDVDGDGLRNRRDRDVDGDGIQNRRDRDVDGDGLRNRRDDDIDGDRVWNPWDFDSDSSGDPRQKAATVLASAPPGFVGLVSDDAFWGTDADPARTATMGAIRGTGARVLRQVFSWALIEPTPGAYDFALHDGFVAAATRAGLGVLPILFDPPAFRSSRPPIGARHGTYPPASNAEFAAYARLLVERYGPGGAFWTEHPELPQAPIRSWQIWNEPNLPQYWPAGPDPAAYAAMLTAVAAAIRTVDPGARLVSAGLSDSELGIPATEFLRAMYDASAKGAFDAVAVHPYAPASDLVAQEVADVVRELRRAGDDARVLITELGWPTRGPGGGALVVSERAQAVLTARTLTQLARLRRPLRLDGVFYFNWRDAPPPPRSRDHWRLHTGLLRSDHSPKPAAAALTRAVRAITASAH
jgi:hypothetical protein